MVRFLLKLGSFVGLVCYVEWLADVVFCALLLLPIGHIDFQHKGIKSSWPINILLGPQKMSVADFIYKYGI
jgi:hypothetical protein